MLDHRTLARLLQQKAIVPVRRVDHVQFDILPKRAKRRGEFFGTRRRVEPVGTERDEQCSRAHMPERLDEASSSVLPCEVEIRQRARRVEIRVRVESPDEGFRLVT